MSSIIKVDIQLLHYHTRPYIWISPPLLFTCSILVAPSPSLSNVHNEWDGTILKGGIGKRGRDDLKKGGGIVPPSEL